METDQLRTSLLLQQQSFEVKEDEVSEEVPSSFLAMENADLDDSFNMEDLSKTERALMNWADLAEFLVENQEYFRQKSQEEVDEEEICMDKTITNQVAVDYRDGLSMKKAWTVGLQEASVINRNRNYRVSNMGSSSTMRMNDILKETSILQPLVLGPRNPIQLLWSFLGSIFILWDLVTIPLEMFDTIPDFLAFLDAFANVTFAFWILDLPTHLIFGREIKGKVELRPYHLAREYLYSWFFLDLMVISIDVGLMLLEDLMSGGWRSARFLRTLRLLRLLRLLRVAKLQQQLTLLANRFLSAHAFMVMKVVAGLLMILAINHIIACCWYGIGLLAIDGKSWIIRWGCSFKGQQ